MDGNWSTPTTHKLQHSQHSEHLPRRQRTFGCRSQFPHGTWRSHSPCLRCGCAQRAGAGVTLGRYRSLCWSTRTSLPCRWLGTGIVHPLPWPQRHGNSSALAPGSSPWKEHKSCQRQNPCITTHSCKSSPAKHVGTAGKEPWEPEHAFSSHPLYAFCTFVFSLIIYLFNRKKKNTLK